MQHSRTVSPGARPGLGRGPGTRRRCRSSPAWRFADSYLEKTNSYILGVRLITRQAASLSRQNRQYLAGKKVVRHHAMDVKKNLKFKPLRACNGFIPTYNGGLDRLGRTGSRPSSKTVPFRFVAPGVWSPGNRRQTRQIPENRFITGLGVSSLSQQQKCLLRAMAGPFVCLRYGGE